MSPLQVAPGQGELQVDKGTWVFNGHISTLATMRHGRSIDPGYLWLSEVGLTAGDRPLTIGRPLRTSFVPGQEQAKFYLNVIFRKVEEAQEPYGRGMAGRKRGKEHGEDSQRRA